MRQFIILIIGILFFSACGRKEKASREVTIAEIKQCDCLKNWQWIKETFENNDAGFQWAIEEKGLERYRHFCDSIENELKKASDIYECQEIINDWGRFFRKGHFFVSLNQIKATDNATVKTETVDYSIETVKLQTQKLKDSMVGIWQSFPYKIGIVRDTVNFNRKYVGFIIESEVPEWGKGEVKIEFFDKNNQLTANFYMQDHSVETRNVWLRNEAELSVGNMKFVNTLKVNALEQQLLGTSKPLFFNLSDETTLLRIPSFNSDQKQAINTLIENNKGAIILHKNLIVDLRGNGGGSDACWKEIIPFIYTIVR